MRILDLAGIAYSVKPHNRPALTVESAAQERGVRISPGDCFANMAYWVPSHQTGRGIATAAVGLLAHFGFHHLGLNRIEIVIAQGNRASMRVAEKAGAQREGLLRRRITIRDQVHDAVMYSLIPEDLLMPEQPQLRTL